MAEEAAPALDPLAEAEAQRDEYLADLQRLAADFDNYRKRALRDQQAFAARGAERLRREAPARARRSRACARRGRSTTRRRR